MALFPATYLGHAAAVEALIDAEAPFGHINKHVATWWHFWRRLQSRSQTNGSTPRQHAQQPGYAAMVALLPEATIVRASGRTANANGPRNLCGFAAPDGLQNKACDRNTRFARWGRSGRIGEGPRRSGWGPVGWLCSWDRKSR
jgi:hypothetical protein